MLAIPHFPATIPAMNPSQIPENQPPSLEDQLVGINAKTAPYPAARSWSGGRRRVLGGGAVESHCYHVMSRTCGGEVFFDDVEKEALRRLLWKMCTSANKRFQKYHKMTLLCVVGVGESDPTRALPAWPARRPPTARGRSHPEGDLITAQIFPPMFPALSWQWPDQSFRAFSPAAFCPPCEFGRALSRQSCPEM